MDEVLEVLERRAQRAALNHATPSDQLGGLGRRTVMEYGERAILLRRSQAVWRMGHGNPITYELLTGAGMLELMEAGTNVVRELVEAHQKFVFVASEPRELALLTIGNALPPRHYAIVQTLADQLRGWFHQRRFAVEAGAELKWDGLPIAAAEWIPRFLDRVASQVVVGVFRASAVAPAHLFYAHVDHAAFRGPRRPGRQPVRGASRFPAADPAGRSRLHRRVRRQPGIPDADRLRERGRPLALHHGTDHTRSLRGAIHAGAASQRPRRPGHRPAPGRSAAAGAGRRYPCRW